MKKITVLYLSLILLAVSCTNNLPNSIIEPNKGFTTKAGECTTRYIAEVYDVDDSITIYAGSSSYTLAPGRSTITQDLTSGLVYGANTISFSVNNGYGGYAWGINLKKEENGSSQTIFSEHVLANGWGQTDPNRDVWCCQYQSIPVKTLTVDFPCGAPTPSPTPTSTPTPIPTQTPEPEDDCEYISFSIKNNDDEELKIKDIDYLIDDIDIILEAYEEGRLNSFFEGESNSFSIQSKIPKIKVSDIKKLINTSKSAIKKALKLDTSDSEKIIKDNLNELSRLRTELAKIKSLKANSESCKVLYKNLPFKSAEIPNSLLSELKSLAGEASYKKFIRALEKGIVPPTGRSGIKALKPSYQDYTYELKIGNSAGRILGKIDGNGKLTFDKFIPKGLH